MIRSLLTTINRRRRLAVGICVAIAAVGLLLILGRRDWRAIAARSADPLPVAHAERLTDGLSYRFTIDAADRPTLYRLGPAPTPISVAAHLGDARSLLLFLYETSGEMTLVHIDRKTAKKTEHRLPAAQLTYSPRFDRNDPGVVWIPVCLTAGVVRFNRNSGRIRRIADFPGETHVFSLDQNVDGSLFVGTYPHHRCLRLVNRGGRWDTEEIPVNAELIGDRPYLHGVFAAGRYLFLHYGSPGRLIRHDTATGRSTLLLDSQQPFLSFHVLGDVLQVGNGRRLLRFDRDGTAVARPPERREPSYRVDVGSHGMRPVGVDGMRLVGVDGMRLVGVDGMRPVGFCRVRFDERVVDVSLFPRRGGMRITALETGPDGRVYGGTYWNTWLFRVDPQARRVTGIAKLPGGSGEFFTASVFNGRLVIPNYQGELFTYDPEAEVSFGTTDPNPRRRLKVPQAHYGICSTVGGGRLYYATQPNYHQTGGMLIAVDPDGPLTVRSSLDQQATLQTLAFLDGRLFGGTVSRRGMGTNAGKADGKRFPPQIIEFDPQSLTTIRQVELNEETGGLVGLIPVGPSQLLCATKKALYRLQVDDIITVEPVSSFRPIQRWCHCRLRRLIPCGETLVLLLAEDFLLAYDKRNHEVRVLARLPRKFALAAVDEHRNLVLAHESDLYLLRNGDLQSLLRKHGFSAQ